MRIAPRGHASSDDESQRAVLIPLLAMLAITLAANGFDGSPAHDADAISSPWELVRRDRGATALRLRYVHFVARRESVLGRVLPGGRRTVDLTALRDVTVNESEREVVITLRTVPTRAGNKRKVVQAFPKEGLVTVRLRAPLGDRKLVHAPIHPDAEDQIEFLRYVREMPQGYGP